MQPNASVLIEDKSDDIVSGRMPQSVANPCLCSFPSILEPDCGHPIGKTAFLWGEGLEGVFVFCVHMLQSAKLLANHLIEPSTTNPPSLPC